mmetsp:Transcript_27196/g.56648  ORF Transcript_27196/g.56648 Transcript_27196/m.56648 type:complete len:270 (+) Transcript_27196:296-1105(+)
MNAICQWSHPCHFIKWHSRSFFGLKDIQHQKVKQQPQLLRRHFVMRIGYPQKRLRNNIHPQTLETASGSFSPFRQYEIIVIAMCHENGRGKQSRDKTTVIIATTKNFFLTLTTTNPIVLWCRTRLSSQNVVYQGIIAQVRRKCEHGTQLMPTPCRRLQSNPPTHGKSSHDYFRRRHTRIDVLLDDCIDRCRTLFYEFYLLWVRRCHAPNTIEPYASHGISHETVRSWLCRRVTDRYPGISETAKGCFGCNAFDVLFDTGACVAASVAEN